MQLTKHREKNNQIAKRESASTPAVPDIIERFLDEFWQPFGSTTRLNQWMPRVDVEETDNEYMITADIPGVNPQDVSVEVVGDTLQLQGKSESEQREHKGQYYRLERQSGSFSRSFTLPANVNTENIHAEIKHGTIVLTLPKTTDTDMQRRKIEVRNSEQNAQGKEQPSAGKVNG